MDKNVQVSQRAFGGQPLARASRLVNVQRRTDKAPQQRRSPVYCFAWQKDVYSGGLALAPDRVKNRNRAFLNADRIEVRREDYGESLDSNKTVGCTSYANTLNRVWRYNLLPILLNEHRSFRSTFCICMAKPTSKPTRHQRTRKDHSTETAEDYVEAVAELIATKSQCRLVELAKYFGVSHVTANRIVARLAKEGLLHTEPYRPIELTASGRRLAKSCQERHEIVRSFLIALGLDSTTADIDSEGIEHHVSPKTLELFQRFVDRLSDNLDS